jgi:hypothetical protein
MGLKCSLLGHSYEPADFERERKEEGSEVVTVTREIERCVRCDEERVVSESTEVAAVVDEDDVEFSDSGRVGADHPAVDDAVGTGTGDGLADRDPAEEDTEILTDEEPDREPGAWPEEPDESWEPDESLGPDDAGESADSPGQGERPAAEAGAAAGTDETAPTADVEAAGAGDEADEGPVRPDEETLSGLTVPEGTIVCTDCAFSVDADSAYREGDPCPDCGAWLTSERNP